MDLLIILIIRVLDIYLWLIIVGITASWLVSFNVLNLNNKWVRQIYNIVNNAIEPPMALVRKHIPSAGGLDFSPMVVIFGIYIVQNFLFKLLG